MGATLRTLARRVTPAGAFVCLLTAAAAAIVPAATKDGQPATAAAAAPTATYCRSARITGYVRSEYGPYTYDGTPTWVEGIAAASWDIPIDSLVEVEGLGTYRIADRGMLGSDAWIDVAVWDRATAYAITGRRTICVTPP